MSVTTAFESDCRECLDALRASLIRLYASMGLDPESPQDIARTFKLNKTLTWKLSKVINTSDTLTGVSHVPGMSAMRIFLDALDRRGAQRPDLQAVRDAAERFEQTIELHVGDRPTLELVLDGLAPGADDRLEMSRKLAFRGNSGIYGVQARTRMALHVLAPNADDPRTLDLAMVRGYVGFRRLRPSVRWPLFQVRAWSTGDDPIMTRPLWEPLEPSGSGQQTCLMPSFSSANLPEICTQATPEGTDIVAMPGPVGNFGAIDCIVGDMMRSAVSRYRSADDSTGELGAAITVPVESLIVDLVVHEDLSFALSPKVVVFGHVAPHGRPSGREDALTTLPIMDEVRELSGRPPAVATPRIPNYPDLLARVCDRLGCPLGKMRAVRLEMKYPPLGANVVLRFELPEAPRTS
ncbi:MAG: hypothetical protein DYG94_03305 [Leptolyngbya sp. PLA3]|nr:MAG: hypothetical protein EDM82_10995 [Cyanobacteria bacterium CYA]MCE7967758.1 hypothetical protein [Leptolyngbya sp. PL-A3]